MCTASAMFARAKNVYINIKVPNAVYPPSFPKNQSHVWDCCLETTERGEGKELENETHTRLEDRWRLGLKNKNSRQIYHQESADSATGWTGSHAENNKYAAVKSCWF